MSKGKRVYLTRTLINAMKNGDELWDSDVVGLYVHAGARGNSFLYAYTFGHGPQKKRCKIGIGITSLEMARESAKTYRDMVRSGKNPKEAIEAERQKAPDPTLADLENRWEVEAKKSEAYWESKKNEHGDIVNDEADEKSGRSFVNMKPATIEKYRFYWKKILEKYKRDKKLASFTLLELRSFHDELSIKKPRPGGGAQIGGRVQANRVLNFLGSLLRAAEKWGMLEEEQDRRIEKMFENLERNREKPSKTFLTEDHFPKFFTQLDSLREKGHPPSGKKQFRRHKEYLARADLFELLLAEGPRIGEFMRARVSWIDWSGKVKVLRLPDSKKGQKDIELGDVAISILKRRCEEWHLGGGVPGDDNDWIIKSYRKKGKSLTNPYKGWRRFLKDAGLPENLVPHSMRHTMVTVIVNKSGGSLEQAGTVVSHKSTKTTQRYLQKMEGTAVGVINRANEEMRRMGAAKELPEIAEDDDNIPSYLKAERDNLKRLQEDPPSSATH